MCYAIEKEIEKERQSMRKTVTNKSATSRDTKTPQVGYPKTPKSLSNLALILNDLDEMIEDLSEAISVDDEQEIYENAKALVEYYCKTKKKLNLN